MGNRSAGSESRLVSEGADGAASFVNMSPPVFTSGAIIKRAIRVFRRLCVVVPAALLVILPVCAGDSNAGDEPTAETDATPMPAAATAAEPTDAGLNENRTAFGTAVDKTHDGIERNILERVIRLDNFFGNVKTESRQKAEYQLRWRNSIRMEQGGMSN